MNRQELEIQLRYLKRSIYGPAQDEMTQAQLYQASHGGLMGPIVDSTTASIIRAEIIKVEALLAATEPRDG